GCSPRILRSDPEGSSPFPRPHTGSDRLFGREKVNSATRPSDKRRTYRRLAYCRVAVILEGVTLFPFATHRSITTAIATRRKGTSPTPSQTQVLMNSCYMESPCQRAEPKGWKKRTIGQRIAVMCLSRGSRCTKLR